MATTTLYVQANQPADLFEVTGSSVGIYKRSATDVFTTIGIYAPASSSTWSCPQTTLVTTDRIQVNTNINYEDVYYESQNSLVGNWTAALNTTILNAATWANMPVSQLETGIAATTITNIVYGVSAAQQYLKSVAVAASASVGTVRRTRKSLAVSAAALVTRTLSRIYNVVVSVSAHVPLVYDEPSVQVAVVANRSVTAASVPAFSRIASLKRTLSVAGSAVATMARVASLHRALSVASSAVASAAKRTSKAFSAMSAALPRVQRLTRMVLGAAASVAATVTKAGAFKRAFAVSASAVPSVSKMVGKFFDAISSIITNASSIWSAPPPTVWADSAEESTAWETDTPAVVEWTYDEHASLPDWDESR